MVECAYVRVCLKIVGITIAKMPQIATPTVCSFVKPHDSSEADDPEPDDTAAIEVSFGQFPVGR